VTLVPGALQHAVLIRRLGIPGAKQEESGWHVVDDTATGARLAVPTRHAPQSSATKSGTRWTCGRSEVQIETFRIAEPGTTPLRPGFLAAVAAIANPATAGTASSNDSKSRIARLLPGSTDRQPAKSPAK
jgi:hypothetical protein